MQLPASIQQACGRLERADEKLTHISESLPVAKKRKMAASRRQNQLKGQVSVTRATQTKLCSNKNAAQLQLEIKKKELQFMKMLLCKGEVNNEDLKVVITGKEAEIAELRGRLAVVEHELSLARKEAQQLRDQLQKATEDLAERSRKVCDIERTQAELERERSRFDMLLSTFAARTQVWYM